MYLWFGINVDNYYKSIKERSILINDELNMEVANFELPYHISLKISFEVENGMEELIIKEVESFYKTLKPFKLKVRVIENAGTILWIRYFDNDYLRNISDELNRILNEKFNIPYHEFDLNFIFHTTIFMNDDKDKIKLAHDKFRNEKLPDELYINKFIIGGSDNGIPYTYKVFKEVEV